MRNRKKTTKPTAETNFKTLVMLIEHSIREVLLEPFGYDFKITLFGKCNDDILFLESSGKAILKNIVISQNNKMPFIVHAIGKRHFLGN